MLEKIRQHFAESFQKRGASLRRPEEYWVGRREKLIGLTDLEGLKRGFGAEIYVKIFEALRARGVREVVDLGCNFGALGHLLRDWGYDGVYLGVDNNPYAVEEATKRFAATAGTFGAVRGNIRELVWEDASFECVIMKDVLEHMEDFRPFLAEAARLAKKYLIVANFIPWTEGTTLVRREAAGFYHNLYRRQDVYAFAREQGFEVEEVVGLVDREARANEIVVFRR